MRFHASFLLALIILFTYAGSLPLSQAGGASPSISRQILTDEEDDWVYIPMTQNSTCTEEDLKGSDKIPDMVGASYFSDGRYLNATIWLSDLFQDPPTPAFLRMPKYSMTTGIIQPHSLKVQPDYVNSLVWNPVNQVWTTAINEYLKNDTRTLAQEDSISADFYDNTGNQGHVNLSLDLEKISSPSQYLVFFIITDIKVHNGNYCFVIDTIEESGQIPLPEFSLSTFPDPLEIRHGERKIIEARINSTSLTNHVANLTVHPDHGNITTNLEPNSTTIPPVGVANLHIEVEVSDEVDPASYSPEIRSNIPSLISMDASSIVNTSISQITASSVGGLNPTSIRPDLQNFVQEAAPTLSNTTSMSQRPSYFTVVVEPYDLNVQMGDFFNVYGELLSLIVGGLGAGFSAISIDRLKNKLRLR